MAKRGMNSSAPVAGDPGAERVDVDYHGESLRMGVLRIKADTVAYGQTGDLTTLLQGAIWGMPTTLYRPATDLSARATALGQAATAVERVRRQ